MNLYVNNHIVPIRTKLDGEIAKSILECSVNGKSIKVRIDPKKPIDLRVTGEVTINGRILLLRRYYNLLIIEESVK